LPPSFPSRPAGGIHRLGACHSPLVFFCHLHLATVFSLIPIPNPNAAFLPLSLPLGHNKSDITCVEIPSAPRSLRTKPFKANEELQKWLCISVRSRFNPFFINHMLKSILVFAFRSPCMALNQINGFEPNRLSFILNNTVGLNRIFAHFFRLFHLPSCSGPSGCCYTPSNDNQFSQIPLPTTNLSSVRLPAPSGSDFRFPSFEPRRAPSQRNGRRTTNVLLPAPNP